MENFLESDDKETQSFYFKDLLVNGQPMTPKEIHTEVETLLGRENIELLYDTDDEPIGYTKLFADEPDDFSGGSLGNDR